MAENFSSPHIKSPWEDSSIIEKHSPQSEPITVDVCIVGAGITGLTAADLLKRSGKTVAVIDLFRVGSGETGHTSGHLTEVQDTDYRDLISRFGIEGAQLSCQSMRRAIDRIEENLEHYSLLCDFNRTAGFKFTTDRDDIDDLEEQADAALRVGVPNELVFDTPLPFETPRAIRFDHQAQFHPLKYLSGLMRAIASKECLILEETRMLDVEEGEPCRVTTDHGVIIADDVFVAANVPSLNRFKLLSKIASYRSYMIATKLRSPIKDDHLYWDCEQPYHFLRSHKIDDVPYVLIGGEDHKTGQEDHTAVSYERLEGWARNHFDVESVDFYWSGQIVNSVDGLPYIGRNPGSDHVYVATGFAGTGLTFGTVAGMIVSDLILGHQNPWVELYSPSRLTPMAAMKNFINENLDYPSHLIGDRLVKANDVTAERLRENEGAIIKVGGEKIAAYRDPEGELHMLSPVCPHLGCHVHWNEAEKSWDCPCHGSRFNPTGKLLNGPAVSDLSNEMYDEKTPFVPEPYETPSAKSNDPLSPPLFTMLIPIPDAK